MCQSPEWGKSDFSLLFLSSLWTQSRQGKRHYPRKCTLMYSYTLPIRPSFSSQSHNVLFPRSWQRWSPLALFTVGKRVKRTCRKNENVENETGKKKEVNTLKGNSSHRKTFSTISLRFKMWVLFHHGFLPDVGIMCINLNNIFSVTHCSNKKQSKDFLPFSICTVPPAAALQQQHSATQKSFVH